MKEWKEGDDNGGATAQGVTKDSIKVVVLWNELPPDQIAMAGVYTNQATGRNEPGGGRASAIDENEVFKHVYETWGRTVELEFVKSTGSDETAQRADALAIKAMKPSRSSTSRRHRYAGRRRRPGLPADARQRGSALVARGRPIRLRHPCLRLGRPRSS